MLWYHPQESSLPLIRFSTTPHVPRFARNLNQWTTGPRPKNGPEEFDPLMHSALSSFEDRDVEERKVGRTLSASWKPRNALTTYLLWDYIFKGLRVFPWRGSMEIWQSIDRLSHRFDANRDKKTWKV